MEQPRQEEYEENGDARRGLKTHAGTEYAGEESTGQEETTDK
jgi:hypothetical protein